MNSASSQRQLLPHILAVLLLSWGWQLWIATQRFASGDEGFYIYAAQLVLAGEQPYTQFFYPQMPLLPYLYALWGAPFGTSFLSARILTTLLSSITAVALFLIFLRLSSRNSTDNHDQTQSGPAEFVDRPTLALAWLTVLLYLSSDLVIAYHSIVKTYTLASACLWLALLAATVPGRAALFFTGLFAALACESRIYLVALLPFILLLRHSKVGLTISRKDTLTVISSLLLGFFPSLWHLAHDWQSYLFNNIRYHGLRNRSGLITGFPQKIAALRQLLEGVKITGGISQQSALLMLATLIGALNLRKGQIPYWLILVMGLILTVISFLPTPVYVQYLVMVVPFFALGTTLGLANAIAADTILKRNLFVWLKGGAICVVIIGHFTIMPRELRRYTQDGQLISGLHTRGKPDLWKIQPLAKITEEIKKRAKPETTVISTWPGYLAGSKLRIARGLENQFSLPIAWKITPSERQRFNVVSYKELANALKSSFDEQQEPPLIVFGYRSNREWGLIHRTAVELGYQEVFKAAKTTILAHPRSSCFNADCDPNG